MVHGQAPPPTLIPLTCLIRPVRLSILLWRASPLMVVGTGSEDNQQLAGISKFLVMEQSGSAAWSDSLRWTDPVEMFIVANRHEGTQEVQTGERDG